MPKIYFTTFGCKTNQYETVLLREKLTRCGIRTSSDFAKADICIINSCTVTGNADADCRQFIRKISRTNPRAKIIVTGCYAQRAREEILSAVKPGTSLLVIPDKDSIPSSLGLSLPAPRSLLSTDYSLLTTGFGDRTRAFIKIQDGCDAFCSYCIVPYVRPKLSSRDWKEIIAEAKNLAKNGYREIVLTGIRLGKYQAPGKNRKIGLVALLGELEKVEGLARIRLSSLEINEIDEKLLKLISGSEKICQHLHIPLQSGDDEILRLMQRGYSTGEFSEKINQVRALLPDIGITTDIIVGFPGETEKNFLSSYNFVERTGFSRIHAFPYSPRPGTFAAVLPAPVPEKIKKERMKKFLFLDRELRERFRRRFIGREMPVLLDKREKNGFFSGFTGNYIRVSTGQGKRNEIRNLKIC